MPSATAPPPAPLYSAAPSFHNSHCSHCPARSKYPKPECAGHSRKLLPLRARTPPAEDIARDLSTPPRPDSAPSLSCECPALEHAVSPASAPDPSTNRTTQTSV